MFIARHNKVIYTVSQSLVITITYLSVCLGCNIISAGSYPFAETYRIASPEQKVIKAIIDFKLMHPEYKVPLKDLDDGRADSTDYWYHIYLYMPNKDRIVHCWARAINKKETTIAIVAINDGLRLGHWKNLNKDFSSSENKKLKKELEAAFISPIKQLLQQENGL